MQNPSEPGPTHSSDCSEPPSLGAGLPYRLTIRCPREPFQLLVWLNPADCQPFNVEFSYTKAPTDCASYGSAVFWCKESDRQWAVGKKRRTQQNRSLKLSPPPYAGCTPSFFSVLPIADCQSPPWGYADFSAALPRVFHGFTLIPRGVTPGNFQQLLLFAKSGNHAYRGNLDCLGDKTAIGDSQ